MSSLFRLPVPGELLWGAAARLQSRFPFSGTSGISELLLGAPQKSIQKLFPDHLEALSNNLPHTPKPSALELIANHTMFPLAAPFLECTDAISSKAKMLGNVDGKSGWRRRCHLAIGTDTHAPMRCCPECLANDVRTRGAALWHRIHQVGPLKFCAIHKCPLQTTRILRYDHGYTALTPAIVIESDNSMHSPSALQLALASDVAELAVNPHWEVGPAKLTQACQIEIRRGGRRLVGWQAARDFTAELIDKFGADELRLCDADLDINKSWAAAILGTRRMRLGVQHFSAVCAVLGISLKDLIRVALSASDNEIGPWPCVARERPCSGKLTIEFKRTCQRRYVPGHDTYRFQCPACGTVYYRPAPLTRRCDGTFVHELHKHDIPDWGHQLRDIWNDPNQTWRSLVTMFGKSRSSIGSQARKLGLKTMPGRSLGSFYRMPHRDRESNRVALIAMRRAAIVDFIEKHPSVAYSDAPKNIRHFCTWVRLNDHRPLPQFPSFEKDRKRGLARIPLRDKAIAELVQLKFQDAWNELRSPGRRRATVTSVVRYFAPATRISVSALARMPKTRALIDKLVETKDQRRVRRVAAILSAIQTAPTLPPWYRFNNKYCLAKMNAEERASVRAAYQKRQHINPNGRVASTA